MNFMEKVKAHDGILLLLIDLLGTLKNQIMQLFTNETLNIYILNNYVVNLDPNFSPLKGKWVNILLNIKWAEKEFFCIYG